MRTLQPIQRTMRRVRTRLARLTLVHDLVLATILMAALFTTSVWYERLLYLSTTVRNIIMWGMLDLVLLFVLVIIIRGLGTWRGWWPWVQTDAIAARVGDRLGTPADRLLNALQLERRQASSKEMINADLLAHAVRLIAQKLAALDFRVLTPRRYKPPGRLVAAVVLLLALAWITAPRSMILATGRLLHPEREYAVPTPFILLSHTGDMEVLGGDTAEVVFTAIGTIPQAVDLIWMDHQGNVHTANLVLSEDRYTHRFEDIQEDIRYHARFVNRAWFSPWDQIISQEHTITIIDRPVIEELTFNIQAPEYTGEPAEKLGGNVADITALVGSRVDLRGNTNLSLESASLKLDDTEEVPITANGKSIVGGFTLVQSTELAISVVDRRGVTNANPVHYTFTALPDYPPTLSVILPLLAVDLDESMMVPVHFDVSDDFGFSQAQITYKIRHPDYLIQDDQTYTHQIPELQLSKRSQRVQYLWELNQLNLMPGDEVHFQIEVSDNNIVSGPGTSESGTMIARVPTLADLFTRVTENSEEMTSTSESILENLEDVKALLEGMELTLRDEQGVSWEQQQKGKEVLETMEEVLGALESVQDQLQKLGAMSEENNLFSDDILQKYDELQNLLEEIMTPELETAMAKLQDALEKMDPEQLRNALQNMQFQVSEFETQLDRYLEIFRRALAEMKMDEVVQRLERMVATEEQLLKQLREISDSEREGRRDDGRSQSATEAEKQRSSQDLAARHKEQERALGAVQTTIAEAAEAVEPFDPPTSQELQDLGNSDLVQDAGTSLQQGTGDLQDQQLAASQSRLQESKALLQALRDEALDIREQFQRSTVNEMLAQFHRIMNGVLTTSKQQEEMTRETEGLSRNSPRVRQAAASQHLLLKSLSQLIEQMIALSRQSFHITPEMGRTVGRANAAMNQAIERLEANDPRGATQSQRESMAALNETALALNNSMAVMQQSGSASGYEQFLQRMQNLSQGQQGLNQQVLSMQLGQMSAMSRIELMRRLQARQRQLAQILEQILEDYPTQTGGNQGGLGQALQDMEEVIKDFQRRRVTRRTLDRQQKIMTRLLDSQKSLTVRDFKEERRGEAPTQILTYIGPSGLPANLGEREDILMQAMEKALRSGYSQDYQIIIQDYFQRLAGRTGSGE
ncbi:MAG: hypothetical protein JSW54_07600 [Fidelibacterota bacterium]|nr:MAG: hypothetical protein JSW54_07600 [Candidatus Neomarinimicrobiota bacterium]